MKEEEIGYSFAFSVKQAGLEYLSLREPSVVGSGFRLALALA